MHYRDEILPRTELTPPDEKLAPKELELALSLVNTMARSFNPEEFEDKYRVALQEVIAAKVKGEEIAVPAPSKIAIPDLMSALRASIEDAVKRASERDTVTAAKSKE
jgi:DNA end-binding protein Ku